MGEPGEGEGHPGRGGAAGIAGGRRGAVLGLGCAAVAAATSWALVVVLVSVLGSFVREEARGSIGAAHGVAVR